MVADAFSAMRFVATLKVAVVAPAATVTDAGTVAAAVLELESVTTAPPVGAGAPSVTVPVLLLPATTVVGFSATDESGAATVSVAVLLTPA